MLERTLWLATFALLLTGGVLLWRRYLEQQTRRLAFAQIPSELAGLPLASGPAVLYFTTATCAQCRFQQTPALAAVQQQRHALQVLKLDAVEHQRLANIYHIMTVPTTVVLDGQRRPVAINHGLATVERLLGQIDGMM